MSSQSTIKERRTACREERGYRKGSVSYEFSVSASGSEHPSDDIFALEVSDGFRKNLERLVVYKKRAIDEGDQSFETFYMWDMLNRLLRDGSIHQSKLVDEYIATQGERFDAAALSRAVEDVAECLSKDAKRE